MGIDLGKRTLASRRTETASGNVYIRLLVKLYEFLGRRTESKFNKVVAARLIKSRTYRPPMSLSRLSKHMAKVGTEGKIAVLVSTLTDDPRMLECPKLTVCALRVTKTARERIVAAGGEVLTFDQLAVRAPTGKNCMLLRGARNTREAVKHFGAAGVPGSHAK
ncbi:60S ribosomal protein L18 [Dimargaris xerosporica]|nr:60S ribosomal protein L18 [Dimargaris xerosporica]